MKMMPPMTSSLMNSPTQKTNVSMFNQYIQIEVNPDCLRFKDAIKKKDHIENACWINTLLDHYADSLMRHKRGKLAKNLTREAILKLIRKGDEEFKTRGHQYLTCIRSSKNSILRLDYMTLMANRFTNMTPKTLTAVELQPSML